MCARVRGKACARASERHRARASEYERKYGQRLQLTYGTQTHTQAHRHRHTHTHTGRQRERMGEAHLQRHRHNGTHDTQLYIHVQVRTKSTTACPNLEAKCSQQPNNGYTKSSDLPFCCHGPIYSTTTATPIRTDSGNSHIAPSDNSLVPTSYTHNGWRLSNSSMHGPSSRIALSLIQPGCIRRCIRRWIIRRRKPRSCICVCVCVCVRVCVCM